MPTTDMADHWATEFKAINGQINVDEAQGIVECFVAAIGNKDSVGDIILPGAFEGSLRRRKPRVVWGHNWNEPIGKVLSIEEVPPGDTRLPGKMKVAGVGGLYARVQFNLKSDRGRQAFLDVSFFGEEQEWSIGYKTLNADYDPQRQANLLRELELYEVSPVLHGANQLTSTLSIKSEEVKGHGGYEAPQMNPSAGRLGTMARALAQQVGGKVRIRKVTDEEIIFDHIADGDDPEDPGSITLNKIRYVGDDGDYKFMEHVRYVDNSIRVDDDDEDEEDNDVDEVMAAAKPGMDSALAREIAREIDGPVKIRAVTRNTVIFDTIREGRRTTMRSSWHAEGGRIMVGEPEMVRAETVYMAVGPNSGQSYLGDEEIKAPIPPDAIPQERFTGDVLRGYGPRRGNLERLLRYWRPIMRKPGGFRRCRVILADHPELYPLNNICAWLHHETTGLWPNEGCHHPTMKNCRRKLRGVVRGSLFSDSEFNNRLRRAGKGMDAGWVGGEEDEMDDDEYKAMYQAFVSDNPMSANTDDDIDDADDETLQKVLVWFVRNNPSWMRHLDNDDNWEIEGDMDDGSLGYHRPEPGSSCGCGGACGGPEACGCGGTCGGCGHGPRHMMGYPGKSAEDLLIEHLITSEEILVKGGRVLSTNNVAKLQQATSLLREVLQSAGYELEMKGDNHFINARTEDIFELRETLEPVLDYYGIDSEAYEDGLLLKGIEFDGAIDAVKTAISQFSELQEKGLGKLIGRVRGRGGGRFVPRDGDGDGFFSPGEGMPDKTPVTQLPKAIENAFSALNDDQLFAENRKLQMRIDAISLGKEKVPDPKGVLRGLRSEKEIIGWEISRRNAIRGGKPVPPLPGGSDRLPTPRPGAPATRPETPRPARDLPGLPARPAASTRPETPRPARPARPAAAAQKPDPRRAQRPEPTAQKPPGARDIRQLSDDDLLEELEKRRKTVAERRERDARRPLTSDRPIDGSTYFAQRDQDDYRDALREAENRGLVPKRNPSDIMTGALRELRGEPEVPLAERPKRPVRQATGPRPDRPGKPPSDEVKRRVDDQDKLRRRDMERSLSTQMSQAELIRERKASKKRAEDLREQARKSPDADERYALEVEARREDDFADAADARARALTQRPQSPGARRADEQAEKNRDELWGRPDDLTGDRRIEAEERRRGPGLNGAANKAKNQVKKDSDARRREARGDVEKLEKLKTDMEAAQEKLQRRRDAFAADERMTRYSEYDSWGAQMNELDRQIGLIERELDRL